MNVYKNLNKVIDYIEGNLENEIEYTKIAQILGVNEYTLTKVFPILCDITLIDYIRKRRLSNAGQDIAMEKEKIVDIAIKYGYNNATSFSRAFKKFHGIGPSKAKQTPQDLKIYTKLVFDENITLNKSVNYNIIKKDKLILYGTYIKTNLRKIKEDAPKLYKSASKKYKKQPDYGMVVYNDKSRREPIQYWVLYENKITSGIKYEIPKSRWIQFIINSQETKEIQKSSDTFYKDLFYTCEHNLRDLPELEYYHDGITEFLIPLEN